MNGLVHNGLLSCNACNLPPMPMWFGGPTLSAFPESASTAQRNNPYFGADLSLADGSVCQLEAAGNFMIRRATLASLAPTFFHPNFAQSGGEDLAFFTQLSQQDTRMHWAANACVYETVPCNRLTDEWLKQRVITIANSRVRVMQMMQPGIGAAALRGIKTCALLALALVTSMAGLVNARIRDKGRLNRWKFWGKFTAHLHITSIRSEGH